MIQFVNTITVKASTERVFNFLADPIHLPQWNYYIKDVKLIAGTALTPGARYHQIRKQDEQFFTLSALDPLKLIKFTADHDSQLWFERSTALKSTVHGVVVNDTFKLRHRNQIMDLLLPLAKLRLRKAVKANLLKLKELIEQGQTILQDSRKIVLATHFSHQSE